jgi:hypothetical protein
MDPADFDVDRRLIPHMMSSNDGVPITPIKKKPRKDPEDLTPEMELKPSVQSSRSTKIDEELTTMSKYVNTCLSRCVVESFNSLASRWLYRTLQVGVQQLRPDYRLVIQMALEAAPLDDMDMAFSDVFGLTNNVESSPRSRNKEKYLQGCINKVFACADGFEG